MRSAQACVGLRFCVSDVLSCCDWQTKHFLLIGFLGMFIGSIVFCYLSFKKKENKMQVSSKTLDPLRGWLYILVRGSLVS